MERWRGQHHVGLEEDNPTWSIVIYLQPLYPAFSSPYSLFIKIHIFFSSSLSRTLSFINPRYSSFQRQASDWFSPECESSVAFLARFAMLGKWWSGTRYPRKEDGTWWTSRGCPRKNLSHTYHKRTVRISPETKQLVKQFHVNFKQ